MNQAAFTDLTVRQASFTAGVMQVKGSAASEPVTERLTLAGLGVITIAPVIYPIPGTVFQSRSTPG